MAHQVGTAALLAQVIVAGPSDTEIQRVGVQCRVIVVVRLGSNRRAREISELPASPSRLALLRGERARVDEVHETRRSSRCCKRRRTGLSKEILTAHAHASASPASSSVA